MYLGKVKHVGRNTSEIDRIEARNQAIMMNINSTMDQSLSGEQRERMNHLISAYTRQINNDYKRNDWLRSQIQQRNLHIQKEKVIDQKYRNRLEEIENVRAQEMKLRQDEENRKKADYREALQKQIEEQRLVKRRQFSMQPHERMLNNRTFMGIGGSQDFQLGGREGSVNPAVVAQIHSAEGSPSRVAAGHSPTSHRGFSPEHNRILSPRALKEAQDARRSVGRYASGGGAEGARGGEYGRNFQIGLASHDGLAPSQMRTLANNYSRLDSGQERVEDSNYGLRYGHPNQNATMEQETGPASPRGIL